MIDIKEIGALKVVELKEKLEVCPVLCLESIFQALDLPTNGLKAELVERLKEHYEKVCAP